MASPSSSRKAPRILSIVMSPPAKPALPPLNLLDLPRELRDVIWTLCLSSPPLLSRKHIPTCQLYDSTADYTTPPARMLYQDACSYTKPHHTTLSEQTCLKSCVRRKGVALLRVNKQIHLEATELQQKLGMHVSFLNSREMVSVLSSLPPLTQQQIHHLVIYDHLPYDSIRIFDGREEYFTLLSKLHNLQHIELSPNIVRGGPYWIIRLLQLRNLKTITLCMPPSGRQQDSESWSVGHGTFAIISKVIDIDNVVPCAHNICPLSSTTSQQQQQQQQQQERVSTHNWCLRCQAAMETIRKDVRAMIDLTRRDYIHERGYQRISDLDEAFERIRREAPTYTSPENPILGSVEIQGRSWSTVLWGVPEEPPEVRLRRKQELRKREAGRRIACIPIRRTKPPPLLPKLQIEFSDERWDFGDDVEDGMELRGKAMGRMRTRVENVKDEVAQRSTVIQRCGRNANSERREAEERRMLGEKEVRDRRESRREVEGERKAGRKRVSRG